MSQYPPMQPPQPYGQPPMGQPPAQRSTSGAAITSLIFGILGCIPIITGLLAIIFGIVGIKATGNPQKSGRAMAIIGLVLGVLSIGGWSLFGGGLWMMYVQSRPAKAVAETFINDMTAGNVSAAMTKCDPSFPRAQLDSAATQMQQWGSLQSLMLIGFSVNSDASGTQWELAGDATFAKGGAKPAKFKFRKGPDGSYKITSFEFQ